MLVELRLENYAVIDNIAVEFSSGLNLLTGETGAGKSILIDALALLLGDKASTDVIRAGADKAVISAVFEVVGSAEKSVAGILESNGIDGEEDAVILRREIATGGKGRVFVNNQPAGVAVLRQIAPHLATIHAQNESILAFDGPARLALLDAYAGTQLQGIEEAFAQWRDIRQRIDALERDEQDRLRLVDLWKFQKREIEEARLHPGEDEHLETEKRVLANAEKIYSAAMNAFDLLYEGNNSTSSSLRSAEKFIEELARYEPKFQEAAASLQSARISVEDVGATVRDYAGGIHASPERLAEIEDRLAAIDRLKRKYGPELQDVIRFGEEVTRKLAEIENKDEVLARLRAELTQAAEKYLVAARAASKKRYEAARKLEKVVEGEINDLAMKSHFQIDVRGSDEQANWTSSGFDEVLYLISTNPGEPLKPLQEIASGGELSRVMLALKTSIESGRTKRGGRNGSGASHSSAGAGERTATKGSTAQRTLVFDEIDAGIGGRAAEAVGKKLKQLSRTKQVLCITHLAQIASFADQHYLIAKQEKSGRVHTSLRQLSGPERSREIARMLSGAHLTQASLENAEQMLKANA